MKKCHAIAGLMVVALLGVLFAIPALAEAAPQFSMYAWSQISPASGTDPGTANGQFDNDYGVALDTQGRLFVSDSLNDRIQILSASGTYVDSISLPANTNPRGIAFGPTGNLFIACFNTGKIVEYNVTTKTQVNSYSASTLLYFPSGVAVGPDGTIYATGAATNDTGIVKFPVSGGSPSKLPSDPQHVVAPGSGITLAPNGNIFVAASTSSQIYEFTTAGVFLSEYGTAGSSLPDVPLPNGTLSNPRDVAVDSSGYIYVADTNNECIQVFDSGGGFAYAWGTSKTSGTDVGQFSYPNGITVDSSGNIYVADTLNNRVQKSGVYTPPPVNYTVSFNVNGGSPTPQSQTITSGGTVTEPADPTKDHYTFAGWYSDSSLNDAWNFSSDTVENDMTLYAKWIPVDYTVTFDAQGGAPTPNSQTVPYGDLVNEPTAPTRDGYTFMGWYSDSGLTTPWNFETDTVEGDMTLYAKWAEDTPSAPVTPASNDTTPTANGSTAYYDGTSSSDGPKTGDDLLIAAMLASVAALGLTTALAWKKNHKAL